MNLKEPKWKYLTKSEFLKKLPNMDNCTIHPEIILQELDFTFPSTNQIFKNGIFYTLQTDEGYLRSSWEIEFYNELTKRNIKFEIEKFYPNQKVYKTDFYLNDYNLYIEIAGALYDETYNEKMQFKKINFGAIILELKDFKNFFKRLDDEKTRSNL